MNPARSGAPELDAALSALDAVTILTADGRGTFDASTDRRHALALHWVRIGSLLKQYVRIANAGVPIAEMTPAVKLRDRLAYQPVTDLDPDLLWDTCVSDTPELRQFLTDLRQAL